MISASRLCARTERSARSSGSRSSRTLTMTLGYPPMAFRLDALSLIADAYEAPGTPRLAADVVVPFAGSETALDALVLRLHELRLAAGDTVVVADNR